MGFSNFFICENLETANAIAFDPKIRKMAVTLDGDKSDPEGFIGGGANPYALKTEFMKWLTYKECKGDLENLTSEKRSLQKLIEQNLEKISILSSELSKEQDYKEELEYIAEQLLKSSEEVEKKKIDECDYKIKMIESDIQELKNQEMVARNEASVNQTKIDNTEKSEGSKASMEMINKELEAYKHKLKEKDQEISDLKKSKIEVSQKLEMNRQRMDRDNSSLTILTAQYNEFTSRKQLDTQDLDLLISAISDYTDRLQELKEAILKGQQALKLEEEEAKRIHEAFENIHKEIDLNLAKREQFLKERKQFEDSLEQLYREIPLSQVEEYKLQNPPHSFFTIKTKLMQQLEAIELKVQELRPKLNRNAENKKDQFFEKLDALNQRKDLIKLDQSEIKNDVRALDHISLNAYKKCFSEVNKNLSEMFSQMLPGAGAMMKQCKTARGHDGIEIVVKFNGKWKESLSELSGGQRSLLALSLLLSMLKYRSAPFYILDEIDAAMDLSHTENIGAIISKNFKRSQFIVISLKQGLYGSANVLYKTSLLQGHSSVQRIQQRSREMEQERTEVIQFGSSSTSRSIKLQEGRQSGQRKRLKQ